MIAQLQQQGKLLQEQINNIKEKTQVAVYETDEEELARKTEWVIQENRKNGRKKMNITPNTSLGTDSIS